jgi:diguanylate cyclase (GGDEF)-like protein
MRRDAQSPVAFAYASLFGLIGWAVLLLALFWPVPPGTPAAVTPPAALFGVFVVVIVLARLMAFGLYGQSVVSLDGAFYVAGTVCLGLDISAWLVAISLSLDAAARAVRDAVRGRHDPRGWVGSAGYALYVGGLSGALLLLCGRLYAVDRPIGVAGILTSEPRRFTVFFFGVTFILLHYLLQAVRLWLRGLAVGPLLREWIRPGIVGELALLPLAVILIDVYQPTDPTPFLLLAVTYLIINLVVKLLSDTSASLKRRVQELETLDNVSRVVTGALQLPELILRVAHQTVSVIPEASIFTIALWDERASQFVVDIYQREGGQFQRTLLPAGEGNTWWIVQHRRPLRIPDLHKVQGELDFGLRGDPSIKSWLGVPLISHDQVIGVISVQSRARAAFDADAERLLDSIAGPAAVAIHNARLYELATVDGLTGLYVRRYFDSRLEDEWRRSERSAQPFSVIITDLDDFKRLNDTYGHQLGDRVLQRSAQVIRKNLRGIDVAARYGGEELAFILPGTDAVTAHAVAERIREELAAERIVWDERVVTLTASFGVASQPEAGATDPAGLLRYADVALYRAKQGGKNRVEIYFAEGPTLQPAAA